MPTPYAGRIIESRQINYFNWQNGNLWHWVLPQSIDELVVAVGSVVLLVLVVSVLRAGVVCVLQWPGVVGVVRWAHRVITTKQHRDGLNQVLVFYNNNGEQFGYNTIYENIAMKYVV